MIKIFLLFFSLFSFSLFASNVKVMFVNGSVNIIQSGASTPAVLGSEYPENIEIQVEEKSEVQIQTRNGTFKIKGKANIKMPQLLTGAGFIEANVTEVSGVRGVYTNIHDQLRKESEMFYSDFINDSGGKLSDHNGWKKVIDSVFLKLMKASGKEPFALEYAIVKQDSFNAMSLPGGQFIIFSNALDVLDQKAEVYRNKDKAPDSQKELYREYILSGLIAHELAHYYNQHSLKMQMKIIGEPSEKDLKEASKHLKTISFSQEQELDADLSGFFLIQKAGYDPKWMVALLEILKELHAEAVASNRTMIPYFQSHPSPNERLSKIPNEKQEWYRFLAKMESVFSDIQLGTNLKNSIIELTAALKTYPNHPDLLKAKAVAQHKEWLETVPLADQQLRSILDMPAFHDNMLIDEGAARPAIREIPGDKELYYNAKETYELALKYMNNADAGFVSNLAVLLAYDPDSETKATRYAESAYEAIPNIQTTNNLGVVYWLVNQQDKAKEIFQALASELNAQITMVSFFSFVSSDFAERWKLFKLENQIRNQFDKSFVNEMYTPILNYALILTAQGDKDAKQVSKLYLTSYDSESLWANYLSEVSNIKLAQTQESFAVEDISIGTTEKEFNTKWKLSQKKITQTIQTGKSMKKIFNYKDLQTKIHFRDGKLSLIELSGKTAPKINGKISIGDKQEKIEKELGKPQVKSKAYWTYKGKQRLKLFFKGKNLVKAYIY